MRALTWLLLLTAIFALGCVSSEIEVKPHAIIKTPQGEAQIALEIVSEPEERMKGLMFREHLGKNEGMWFVFEEEVPYSFWMKNTLIPLDMVFVGSDLRIVDILKADPCILDPCTHYTPQGPALYVLEVNQNATDRLGISIGQSISIKT